MNYNKLTPQEERVIIQYNVFAKSSVNPCWLKIIVEGRCQQTLVYVATSIRQFLESQREQIVNFVERHSIPSNIYCQYGNRKK